VPPQDIHAAACLFGTAYRYFPSHTIHVVVVDPGVGTERYPIAVVSDRGTFVCPDNGLLSYVLADAGLTLQADPFVHGRAPLPAGWAAFHLTNERFWVQPLSNTFHGRDVFAPSAAFLAAGTLPSDMGAPIADVEVFAVPVPLRRDNETVGQVLHIDRFGNLVTNLRPADLPRPPLRIEVRGHRIDGLSEHYQAAAGLLALVGSGGTLELAVANGNAASFVGAAIGTDVRVIGAG
jgi:S-adenosylmethionine hydrolase